MSKLLSQSEKQAVLQVLGADTEKVAMSSSGVVQLLIAEPGQTSWTVIATGVAAFVKDWSRRGFFISVR
jgi:hypothetical protein